jgi:hypothetical protein
LCGNGQYQGAGQRVERERMALGFFHVVNFHKLSLPKLAVHLANKAVASFLALRRVCRSAPIGPLSVVSESKKSAPNGALATQLTLVGLGTIQNRNKTKP